MWRWLAWLAVALVLAACASQPATRDEGLPLGPPLERFAADGRISLRQGDRSDHFQFDWQHAPDRDVVLFSTPLGQGLAELGRDPAGAWLKVPGKAEQRAADLSALTQKLLGASLPLEVLAGWMGGSRTELQGEVDGWLITVSESMSHRERRLPRRIEVRRDDIELRIVVNGWGEND